MKVIDEMMKWYDLTEIPQNQGWNNIEIMQELTNLGWKKGDSWCAVFIMYVFKKAYPERPELMDILNKSAYYTLFNVKKHPEVFEIIDHPEAGCIALWVKKGKGWQPGHEALIVYGNTTHFVTIGANEGNRIRTKVISMLVPDEEYDLYFIRLK